MITIFLAAGVGAYALILSGSVAENSRQAWYKLDVEQKQIVENQYACCGFNTFDEKTDGCEFDQTCDEPVVAELTGKIKFATVMAAICAVIQVSCQPDHPVMPCS